MHGSGGLGYVALRLACIVRCEFHEGREVDAMCMSSAAVENFQSHIEKSALRLHVPQAA